MWDWVCSIFGHRFKMESEDEIFFVYTCRTCGKIKFVSKNKFPKDSKLPYNL